MVNRLGNWGGVSQRVKGIRFSFQNIEIISQVYFDVRKFKGGKLGWRTNVWNAIMLLHPCLETYLFLMNRMSSMLSLFIAQHQ